MKQRVMVWGKPIEVEVYQKSKSVWIASGTYLDMTFQVQDRSPTSAANLWAKTATYRSN